MKKLLFILLLFGLNFVTCTNDNELPFNGIDKYNESIQGILDIMNMDRPDDSYNYPVYPGTKEWESLSSGDEMLKACQIPEKTTKAMSTQALIQAIWEYPLVYEVFHRYQYQRDFEALFFQNNAYIELCKRKDAGKALLTRMEAVDPLSVDRVLKILDLLIAQNVFASQLNTNEKRTVIEIGLRTDELRQQQISLADGSDRAITWLMFGRVMKSADFDGFVKEVSRNEQLNDFLNTTNYVYMDVVYGDIPQIIVHYAQDFIQTN